jgi:imidazolonepropionase-like amidohydrolase
LSPHLHLRGVLLPDEVERDVWVVGGHLTFERPDGEAETVSTGGWILPGLVDSHCHIGLGHGPEPVEGDELREQCEAEVRSGALLVRDAGAVLDTHHLDDEPWAPRIVRCGRWLARPKRYSPGVADEVEPADLVEAVTGQAKAGDGWVKLIGDWIDRPSGDLAPLWDTESLIAAVEAAHALGARVAVHTFGEEALDGLITAGVDSIEHGTGLTDDHIDRVVARGIAVVPTLLNVENFPSFADAAVKYPVYAERMRRLHASAGQRFRHCVEAGVPIYAGTDSGSMISPGSVAEEILAMHAAGLPAADAVAAGSWAAREWLGRDGLVEGAHADLVVYDTDPRTDIAALRHPKRIVHKGAVV